jgi:tRNA (cmo5U34)-methyltransferase
MKSAPSPVAFDAQHAAAYDERWAPLAPLRDSLHLQMRLILQPLPADAHVLCAGAGTGAELVALAHAFPGWSFVAVDPSAPMLDACRRRIEREGLAARCAFHAGYVSELPTEAAFDAATSILVSQFITDRSRRVAYFRDLASRLRPDGVVVTADLGVLAAEPQEQLFAVWRRLMALAGATEAQLDAMAAAYGRDVALLRPAELEALLIEAGFATPVRFSQSLLIHAWFARKESASRP